MSQARLLQRTEKSKNTKTMRTLVRRTPLVLQRVLANPQVATPAHVLQLQRQYGNRVVNQLLGGLVQRDAATVVTPDQVTITNNGTGVTAEAITVLKEIVAAIGETSATITSGRRTPAEQAAAMYTNLENTGVDAQKALYGANGDKVIDVYVAGKAATKDAETIKQEMTAKINEIGPSKVSKHCSENSVIDVAPSSITDDTNFQTQAEANARVTKYLGPNTTPSDPAHHLEIT